MHKATNGGSASLISFSSATCRNSASVWPHRPCFMLTHYHGQTWNAADPARSLGVNESTVRRYLDWLTQTCMVRQLQPWHANIGKRQVCA